MAKMKNLSNKLFDLSNYNILVTGATGHLGAQICYSLADNGANVLVNGRNKIKVENIVKKITKRKLKAESIIFDVTNKKEIKNSLKKIKYLNVIINNAYKGNPGSIKNSQDADYFSAFEVGLMGAVNVFNESFSLLKIGSKKFGDASVINISSMYSIITPDLKIYKSLKHSNPPYYGLVKSALNSWTKYGALEFGKIPIRFNSISPGPFPKQEFINNNKITVKKIISKSALNRIASPIELSGSIIYLSSKASSYVTGSNLIVDGGYSIT